MGYPPGSVFKLVTAYAGMSEGIIASSRYISCGVCGTALVKISRNSAGQQEGMVL